MPEKGELYEATANREGVLGYEGLFRYAKSARETGDTKLERDLLLMFRDVESSAKPIRAQDILVSALETLVHDYGQKLKGQLELARHNQF